MAPCNGPISDFLTGLQSLAPADPQYATEVVERLLTAARGAGASDIHLLPGEEGLELRFRIDGVLRPLATVPRGLAANVIARLKVKAELLTYRSDVPQEGRIRLADGDAVTAETPAAVEMRVSTFPTLYGERAVVRLFGRSGQLERLDDLGLPADVLAVLRTLCSETSGAILVSGPAGSGKTTTVYACLRALLGRGLSQFSFDENETVPLAEAGAVPLFPRSVVSLEDPIEVAVPGVAQSQVNPAAGLDLATGLRFLMRQDPEVIMVGEIRDRATAEAALQASLTGHLLVSTFHAGGAAETLGRLLDMGIEPYVLRSGLLVILSQRLLRGLCSCARESDDPALRLGLPVKKACVPVGCPACGGTGYRGRFLLVEMLALKSPATVDAAAHAALGRAILERADTTVIHRLAVAAGMVDRWQRACQAVEAGRTSPAEVRRVLGLGLGS